VVSVARGDEPPTYGDAFLPTPTGPFSVGRSIFDLTDASRDELDSNVPGEHRSVVAWIWYPADVSSAPTSDYMPGLMGELVEKAIGLASNRVHTSTHDDAPLASTGSTFPVLIFSHGSGSILAAYTSLLSEVASHGYVVVGVQHPYNAMITIFADGRVIPASPAGAADPVHYWSEDTAFVVDELDKLSKGSGMFGQRLDLTRFGMFGHSFGGAVAAEFCHEDQRCVAGLNFDGSLSGDVEKAGLAQPFMQVLSAPRARISRSLPR
jgi:alpha-beta hydrolase superfamily lysophospholipase